MDARERDPAFLIREGHLEPLVDFTHEGAPVLASRLGYRVTAKFVRTFLGRIFDYPARVFDEAFLRPETQDLGAFVDGVHNITEAQQWVARQYFDDGSIAWAAPPLAALLHIMAEGSFEGMSVQAPEVRRLFARDALIASDWYRDRLSAKQGADIALWRRHLAYLDQASAAGAAGAGGLESELPRRRAYAAAELERVSAPGYLDELVGTIGLDPLLGSEG
jgi:hypothetical protein